MRPHLWMAVVALVAATACEARGPVVDVGNRPPNVGGTIAGSVSATGETTPVPGRKVTAVNEETKARFETSTSETGAYTLKVPSGKYRLELELRAGETLETQPDVVDVGVGDIDAARNFVITRR